MGNDKDNRRLGLLFVGLSGATASTVVSGTVAMKLNIIKEQYGITDLSPLKDMKLIGCNDFFFGGWDYVNKDQWESAVEYNILPKNVLENKFLSDSVKDIFPSLGLRTELDIPLEQCHNNVKQVDSISSSIDNVRDYINNFKIKNNLSCVITFYLGSPHKRGDIKLSTITKSKLQEMINTNNINSIPSCLIYAIASVLAGAHFVDFTPSETIETPALNELALENGVQLAGRDGSTGQTMLKVIIAQLLKIRNFHLDSWFSTNILGNHDGYVLNLPGHDEIKISDKTDCLKKILGYDDFEHLVTIHYFKARGDRKESWDVADFSGWLGTKMSLRINWYGEDSILAAPLILDLARLIEYGALFKLSGLQSQLALFFKCPFGRENIGLIDRFNELVEFYLNLK